MRVDQNHTIVNTKKKKKKNGSIRSIFMHADSLDWFLMVLGVFGAMGDGFTTPISVYIMSGIVNNVGGVLKMTPSTFIHNVNKVLSL
ncbi:ABC transporter B family member 18 [Glycine soja]|uniref:ABC transporter B family member 18 n=1 Tax=Glycine soja TaxID=3848 RepID=A0A0B2RLX6_GLYSO|nr:ABC transporter B family member 18 [Glycine soja]